MEANNSHPRARTFGSDLTNVHVDRPLKVQRPIVVSVEAAIGTGKSSLLRLIQQKEPTWVVVQEPVDKWQDINGHNLLDAFYGNLERYAFSFQTYCVLSRIEAVTTALQKCPQETPVVVLERSWFSDRATFAEMLHKTGRISDMEWNLYQEWYSFAVRNSPTIDGHLYLECGTDTCMTRLRKRSRSEEVGVTSDYQRDLITHHEDWLNGLNQSKVHRVNVDQDFLNDVERSEKMVETVRGFISELRDQLHHA